MASANVPESAAVSVELDGGGIEQKMEPMFGSSLKGRMQQRLPARLRGKPEGAGLFDPFTNGTEGPGAPPYSWLEIVKTVLMTPIAVVRILLFFCEMLLPVEEAKASRPTRAAPLCKNSAPRPRPRPDPCISRQHGDFSTRSDHPAPGGLRLRGEWLPAPH